MMGLCVLVTELAKEPVIKRDRENAPVRPAIKALTVENVMKTIIWTKKQKTVISAPILARYMYNFP